MKIGRMIIKKTEERNRREQRKLREEEKKDHPRNSISFDEEDKNHERKYNTPIGYEKKKSKNKSDKGEKEDEKNGEEKREEDKGDTPREEGKNNLKEREEKIITLTDESNDDEEKLDCETKQLKSTKCENEENQISNSYVDIMSCLKSEQGQKRESAPYQTTCQKVTTDPVQSSQEPASQTCLQEETNLEKMNASLCLDITPVSDEAIDCGWFEMESGTDPEKTKE